MQVHKSEWTFYILGALLTLLYKWARWCYVGKKLGKNIKQSSVEWFFESTAENAVSWGTTIGVVWLVGSIYIDRVIEFTGITSIPVIDPFAFLLGSMAELTVPSVTKWILSKFPS